MTKQISTLMKIVYTATPTSIMEPQVQTKIENDLLHIQVKSSSDIDRITISKINDLENWSKIGSEAEFILPLDDSEYLLCLTGYNKVPYFQKIVKPRQNILIQNTIISGSHVFEGIDVKIGSDINPTDKTGKVRFERTDVTVRCKSIEIHPDTEITKNSKFKVEIEE